MAKHLLVDGAGDNWRLPADTDLSDLADRIMTTMAEGGVLDVRVEFGDTPLGSSRAFINTRNVRMLCAVETPEPS